MPFEVITELNYGGTMTEKERMLNGKLYNPNKVDNGHLYFLSSRHRV